MRLRFLSALTIATVALIGWPPGAYAAPANDACASPTVIASLPFTDAIDTTDATSEAGDPVFCGGPSPGTRSVWYAVTPAVAGTLYATTLASGYDTALAAYTGTCATLIPLACNDALDSGPTSYVSFPVQAGVTVLLEVLGSPGAGVGEDGGTLHLSVDLVPDKAAAKAVGGCQKALQKSGATFALAALKNIDKCTSALFKCLETSGGDSACFFKNCDACHAELPTSCQGCHSSFSDSKDPFAKLVVHDVGACDAVPFAQLMKTTGLGYDLRGECAAPADVVDIGSCTASQHDCDAATLIGAAVPRARELVEWCDRVPAELDCLPDHGTAGWLADPALAKVVTKCQAAVVKATTKLVIATLKSLQSCVAATFDCVATKNADLKCLNGNELVTGKSGGADVKCDKQYLTIAAARAKLAPAIDKACGVLPFDTLKSAEAANVGALATECMDLGVPALATLGDYEECLARRQLCVAENLVRLEAPRGDSLLQIVSPIAALDDRFCVPSMWARVGAAAH